MQSTSLHVTPIPVSRSTTECTMEVYLNLLAHACELVLRPVRRYKLQQERYRDGVQTKMETTYGPASPGARQGHRACGHTTRFAR
jgi:hypothetical protein